MDHSEFSDSDVELSASSRYQRTYISKYYGRALVERWHTQPMLSWIIAELKRIGAPKSETVFLSVTDNSIKAVNVKYGRFVFEHKLTSITKFNQLADSPKCFAYLTKEGSDVSLCHAFQAADEIAVFQLFTVLKDAIQELNRRSPLAIKQKESSPFDAVQNKQCQQYEVLYIGKLRVSQNRGSHKFVDEAVEKINDKNRIKENVLTNEEKYFKPIEKPPECTINVTSDVVLHPLSTKTNLEHKISENSQKHPLDNKSSDSSALSHSLAPPSSASLITHSQSLDASGRAAVVQDIQALVFNSEQFSSIIEDGSLHRQTSLPPMNAKSFLEYSMGFSLPRDISSNSLSDDHSQDNRTMLFLISQCDICLISTDKKELLFQKEFPDISHCSQGEKYSEYFGIICRETTMTGLDIFVGYIFQCQSAKIVNEIMKTLKQSFHCALKLSQEKRSAKTFNFCETCPMYSFHKLCSELEGASSEQVQSMIMTHIASLPEKQQRDVMSKYQEIVVRNPEEQNIVFMMLLRALSERKQMKHTHVSIKDQKEHSHKTGLSPLNSLTSLAKRTFPGSFESVFKEAPLTKTHSLPPGTHINHKLLKDKKSSSLSSDNQSSIRNVSSSPNVQAVEETNSISKKEMPIKTSPSPIDKSLKSSFTPIEKQKNLTSIRTCNERSLSDTAAVLWELQHGGSEIPQQTKENFFGSSDMKISDLPRPALKASPLRNIFLKVGTRKSTFPLKEIKEQHNANHKGSWRKMLFNRVQSPFRRDSIFEENQEEKQDSSRNSSSHLKALWKKAIAEQIVLIRLEREQKKLKIKQDKILEKHIKLDYEVISPSPPDAIQKWEQIMKANISDYKILESAVKYGVPRKNRGEIWCFLAEKYCSNKICSLPEDIPYNELMCKLTPYQHAILIDIGRTYPGHPYFKQALGSGQLALFSLLKAYSVVDEEVGYCQGLSFLGGILLLHMDEEKAFQSMKHIMFTLGLRNQYKSDMAVLQVQMYQLARIIQTIVPEIHELFDKLDVSPVLYAAPWFLTLFASHFPVGFVARLLDMIFLQGIQVLFKVTVLLLKIHQLQILKCSTFESVVYFLKTTLPSSGHVGMEKVLDEVLSMDVSNSLHAYQIEYMVLKEEISEQQSEIEPKLAHQLEKDNKELQKVNMELSEQLQVSQNRVSTLQASVTSYQSTIRKLESHVSSLQDERDALHHSVNILRRRLETLENSMSSSSLKQDSDLSVSPPIINIGIDDKD